MPAQTTNLFLLEDLEDVGRTSELGESDRDALHALADWIKTYVVKPHKDLGRDGPVCPFVPGALARKTLWLAPEQIADRDVPEVVELINGYQRLFLDAQPTDGDDANYKVTVQVPGAGVSQLRPSADHGLDRPKQRSSGAPGRRRFKAGRLACLGPPRCRRRWPGPGATTSSPRPARHGSGTGPRSTSAAGRHRPRPSRR
jgi:hypothetical protein